MAANVWNESCIPSAKNLQQRHISNSTLTLSWQLFVNLWMSIPDFLTDHYNGVITGAIASQITSPAIVYSTLYSGTHQRKHQSSASLAVVWGIHQWPVNSPHKGPVTQKMFPFDDVIMYTVSSRLPPALFFAWNHSIVMLWLVLTSRNSKRVSCEIDIVI